MSGQIPRPIRPIAFVATLLISGAGAGMPTNIVRAGDCLAQPNSTAPSGSHWYYRLDWPTQRKCWYLRAPDQPAQHVAAQAASEPAPATRAIPIEKPATASHSAPAPISISPSDTPPPWPHITILAVKPQRAPSATTDEPVQQSMLRGSTETSIPAVLAPQASPSSQISAQAAEPVPDTVQPDPSVAKAEEPTAIPSDVRSEAVQSSADAIVPDDARSPAQGDASTTNTTGMTASLTQTTPAEMFPILALALVVAGLFFRLVIRIAASYSRERIMINSESDLIDDGLEYELGDDQLHGSVREPDELIDDDLPRLADDQWSDNSRGKDRASDIIDEIRKREDMLEELKRNLDRMLRSPRAARNVLHEI